VLPHPGSAPSTAAAPPCRVADSYASLCGVMAVVLAVFGVVVFGALYVVMVRRAGHGPAAAVSEEQAAPA
jgi:hypothetical protein